MKTLINLILLIFAISPAAAADICMNRGWHFAYGDSDGACQPGFDDSNWQTVNLPHDFQIYQPWTAPGADEKADTSNQMANIASRLSSRGFKEMGIGWYRKSFVPDGSWRGRRVLLDFGGIMLVGDIYLNGEHIGGTDYGYLGFEIDITDKLKFDEDNIIAVRADTGAPENSRWYTGGGLYRDVKIRITDPAQYFTRHSLAIATPTVSP
ncbi:MAG: beta-galactosidase, partial [Muribaculaceae bacterium]|nr:beta-galactosidase [Muribaculaceae bacterium]